MFKLYQNKTSVAKRKSRYVQGGTTDIKQNSIGWWEKRTDIIQDEATDAVYTITKDTEHRPDLVSNLFYNTSSYDWLILQYNFIVDIIEEFSVGMQIKIPRRDRVLTSIINRNQKFIR